LLLEGNLNLSTGGVILAGTGDKTIRFPDSAELPAIAEPEGYDDRKENFGENLALSRPT